MGLLILLAVAAAAFGGSIHGVVSDVTGAAVQRVPVVAKHVPTGVVYEARASSTGSYALASLPQGAYEISIVWTGFRNFRQSVEVQGSQSLRLDIRLEDGELQNTLGELYFLKAGVDPPSGPAPRAADGKPDLSGVWMPHADIEPEQPPLLPDAAALYQYRQAHRQESPRASCLPTAFTRTTAVDLTKFVQTPALLVILVEGGEPVFRQIFLDGRPHPKDPFPTWLGHSTGRWEGDTLLVDTIGINGKAWLSNEGLPQTEQMHVVERYRRPDLGHLEVEIVFDDPGAYSRPWKLRRILTLAPEEEIQEFICNENNKDPQNLRPK